MSPSPEPSIESPEHHAPFYGIFTDVFSQLIIKSISRPTAPAPPMRQQVESTARSESDTKPKRKVTFAPEKPKVDVIVLLVFLFTKPLLGLDLISALFLHFPPTPKLMNSTSSACKLVLKLFSVTKISRFCSSGES